MDQEKFVSPTSLPGPTSNGRDISRDEKEILDDGVNSSSSVFDLKEGDEALQLVGAVRTAEFTSQADN